MLAAVRALVEQQPVEEDYSKFRWNIFFFSLKKKKYFLRVICSAEKFPSYPVWELALRTEMGPTRTEKDSDQGQVRTHDQNAGPFLFLALTFKTT